MIICELFNEWVGRGSIMGAETVEKVIIGASVGAIGALIAGLTALVQAWFAGRDARLRATAQLDLATRRTSFVAEWLDVQEKLGDANGRLVNIRRLAEEELAEAYDDAQRGSEALHEVVEGSASKSVVKRLRGLLLLREGLRPFSKLVVAGFYLSLGSAAWVILTTPQDYQNAVDCQKDPTLAKCGPDTGIPSDWPNLPAWQWVIVSFVTLFVLRMLFGLWVNWLERDNHKSLRPVDGPDEAPN